MQSANTLGKRLKYCREKKGIKQNHAAKEVGVAPSTLAGYESDFRDPDTETLKKLADLYGVQTDYLLGKENDPVKKISSLSEVKELVTNDDGFIKQIIELSDEDLLDNTTFTYKGVEISKQKIRLIVQLLKSDFDEQK